MPLTECIEHLVTLILTGRLDDELARDRNAVIACALRVVSGLAGIAADKLDPEHIHALGAALDVDELRDCCGRLAGESLGAEVKPSKALPIWVSLLMPVLLKMLERWLADDEA